MRNLLSHGLVAEISCQARAPNCHSKPVAAFDVMNKPDLYCHLPVSGRGMQRFLQFRLGCHGLPVAAGRLAGAAHVGRAHRVCLACNGGAVGDEMHLIFECTALASLRSRYASLFTDTAGTMRSFFAQPDHIGVFHYVIDCLDFMMI